MVEVVGVVGGRWQDNAVTNESVPIRVVVIGRVVIKGVEGLLEVASHTHTPHGRRHAGASKAGAAR